MNQEKKSEGGNLKVSVGGLWMALHDDYTFSSRYVIFQDSLNFPLNFPTIPTMIFIYICLVTWFNLFMLFLQCREIPSAASYMIINFIVVLNNLFVWTLKLLVFSIFYLFSMIGELMTSHKKFNLMPLMMWIDHYNHNPDKHSCMLYIKN